MVGTTTIKRTQNGKRHGKSASTLASRFVREEMEHIGKGKHGPRSTKQAIAIGLSKARKAGVTVKPRPGTTKKAGTTTRVIKKKITVSKARPAAATKTLKKAPRTAASHRSISRQVRTSAKTRTSTARPKAVKRATTTRTVRKPVRTVKRTTRSRATAKKS